MLVYEKATIIYNVDVTTDDNLRKLPCETRINVFHLKTDCSAYYLQA